MPFYINKNSILQYRNISTADKSIRLCREEFVSEEGGRSHVARVVKPFVCR